MTRPAKRPSAKPEDSLLLAMAEALVRIAIAVNTPVTANTLNDVIRSFKRTRKAQP